MSGPASRQPQDKPGYTGHTERGMVVGKPLEYYVISSGDNAKQRSMTQKEAERVAKDRGMTESFPTIEQAVEESKGRSKKWGERGPFDPTDATEHDLVRKFAEMRKK